MARTWALALMAAAGAALLCGCKTVTVPYNQKITAVLVETTKENPVKVTLAVDGKEVYGPTELLPGQRRDIVLHDPSPDSTARLSPPNEQHVISWRLHRNGVMGKVGHADLTILNGSNQVLETASTKYVWPVFWVDGRLNLKFEQPGGPAALGGGNIPGPPGAGRQPPGGPPMPPTP